MPEGRLALTFRLSKPFRAETREESIRILRCVEVYDLSNSKKDETLIEACRRLETLG